MSSPAGGDDRLIKSAYGTLRLFVKNLGADYQLTPAVQEAIVLEALQQHGEHLIVHRIEQKSVDALKLVCWLGGALLEREKANEAACHTILDGMLKTLHSLLYLESKKKLVMPRTALALLKSFLLQERACNGKHGIWMNGLYLSFHCSIASYRNGLSYQIPL